MDYDEFLKHYGIKGMRWGIRRRRISKGVDTSNKNRGNSNKRRMSNKELVSRVKRLKLEQEYAKLTATPAKQSKVESIVKGAGTLANFTTSSLTIYKNLNELSKIANQQRNNRGGV